MSKMIREISALIELKNGTGHISLLELRSGSIFTKKEMEKFIKNKYRGQVKRVTFL